MAYKSLSNVQSGGGGGSGTVTSVSATDGNGLAFTITNPTTTPNISIALGAITPTSVASSGTVTGSNLSGTNTGDQTTITGNAGTATALANSRTISTVGDVVYTSAPFNGTANVSGTATLATVNTNVGAFGSASQVATFTVNGKGLITAAGTALIQIAESQVTNLTTDLAGKQGTITLTTTGTSGTASFIANTLNIPNYTSGGGGGSVTSVSVVTANGFAGTVAAATSTPAITLTTSITGLLKGNGTAISAASAGTDYQAPITLTTTGTTGTASFIGNTLNIPNYTSGGGSGSVTSVSVVTANGFAGTVASATSTPAITLTTSITGLLKGNGTSISSASAGTDYQAPISLTTTGTSGTATFSGNTLNIPVYANTTYTAGTGLTLSTGSFSVNTTQAISNLSNLTGNGLVKTSGGAGALSTATAGTDYQAPITLTTTGTSGTASFIANTLNIPNYSSGGGTGTVTSVSVASANGLAGTVAAATSTPVITLSTSITGLLKGNGTAISAASAGTDYQAPIVLTTTGTTGTASFIGNTLNIPNYTSGGGAGTVTSVSVVSANGFAGTVAAATSTPAITISTSITGLLKGNGTAVSAASAGTDYVIPGTNNNLTTLTGVTGAISSPTSLTFTGVSAPAYAQGKLVYDTDNESLTFFNNDSTPSLQIGQEEWIRVTNATGSSIANGSAVYINGASAGLPSIALAQANVAATTICVGLTTEAIANGAIGYVTCIGVVHGLDTSGFTAGSTVFVSSTVAGGLVSTAPTAPNYRYRVGIVAVSSATVGTVHVTPSTAALGNGTANQVFGMNTAGTAQEVKTIAAGAGVTVTNTTNLISIAANSNTRAIAQTTHGFTVGQVIRLSAASTYATAKADTVGNAEAIGMVSTVVDANNFIVTTGGVVTGLSGLTANTVYFLDPSVAGGITATAPTTNGQVIKPLFISDTTTSGYFNNFRGQQISATKSVTAAGTVTLVAGTAIVSTAAATATALIFLTPMNAAGANSGVLRISATVAGVSFTITSTAGLDNAVVNYQIMEP